MRAQTHVLVFRMLLLCVLVWPALHCADSEGQPASCGGCDCWDENPPADDDDSSGIAPADDDDSAAPEDPTAELPPCDGGVLSAFDEVLIAPPAADSEGYAVPGEDTLSAIEISIETLVAGNADLAVTEVLVIGYELCKGVDEEAGTALWRPIQPGSGRPLLAFRAMEARPLVVEVPHPWSAQHSLEQGVEMFDELGARALLVGGTHRCANSETSGCDGATEACGVTGEEHRISDMAHAPDSIFQVAHEQLSDLFETDWLVSLQGMEEEGISLSNGTSGTTSDPQSAEALLGPALMAAFPGEDITSCNSWPGAVVESVRCGSTNVQGRYTNGSAAPCEVPVLKASGRFLHLQQGLYVRERFGRVVDAMNEVLPELD